MHICLAHSRDHVVNATDLWESVTGWIVRTFRDVKRLDDRVVDEHTETFRARWTELRDWPWLRQFNTQVFNHN